MKQFALIFILLCLAVSLWSLQTSETQLAAFPTIHPVCVLVGSLSIILLLGKKRGY